MTDLLVHAEHLGKVFHSGRGDVIAVRDISFSMVEGSCLGLVGGSGSGKTTTARMVVGLERPTSGEVRVGGIRPYSRGGRDARLPDLVQMIFQDPYQSLSPRMSAGDAVGYPLRVRRMPPREIRQRVSEVFEEVGLPWAVAGWYPHQLSTGQRQRIGIARALVTRPRLIVADEPLSSVDVSLQSQILNLLSDIQRETNVTYLLISHDLAVVGQLCDRVIVMRSGDVVEEGPMTQILDAPRSAYTHKLVAAAGISVA